MKVMGYSKIIRIAGFIAIVICLLYSPVVNGQVAINNDGSSPNEHAMLDIESSEKGLLIPRMDSTARKVMAATLTNNETGLLIFDIDNAHFYFWDGLSFVPVNEYNTSLTDKDGDTQVQVEESKDEDIIRFDLAGTERWVMTGSRLEPRMRDGLSI